MELLARSDESLPAPGIALCLSGGGYRAMLFHLGALWRLNEMGYLSRLDRVSSVSGGSITAGYLGMNWSALKFDDNGTASNFGIVVDGIRRLASVTIDVGAVLRGVLLPGSVSDRVVASYDRYLFNGVALDVLPQKPSFVINASNLQSGALWRFSSSSMRDWRVGKVSKPGVSLATAVAASSAFPPVLAPLVLQLDPETVEAVDGADLSYPPYTSSAVLVDGGVYDNLGLETIFKRFDTILASDAGARIKPMARPPRDWFFQLKRVVDVIDSQVRAQRRRDLISAFEERRRLKSQGHDEDEENVRRVSRSGAYWGIRTEITDYGLRDALECPPGVADDLASVPTRLAKLPSTLQERLINWGYAVCDAAMRAYAVQGCQPPTGFPYSRGLL